MKLKCEEMYPWIVAYSRGVQDDFGVTAWLLENGQSCPNCAAGVERIEGCFHMTCESICSFALVLVTSFELLSSHFFYIFIIPLLISLSSHFLPYLEGPTCATHFCYECGQEIFYPFYGTHHCWEEQAMFEQFQ